MTVELLGVLKASITAYTGLSPATFFTVLALGLGFGYGFYYVVSGRFSSSSSSSARHHTMSFEEQVEPLRPPFQVGEISEDELKQYDGTDPKKPFLTAIRARSMMSLRAGSVLSPLGFRSLIRVFCAFCTVLIFISGFLLCNSSIEDSSAYRWNPILGLLWDL